MKRLANKTALVTGGRQGIGRGIVEMFVSEGATVLSCGRGARPSDLPASVLWVTADVSQQTAVDQLQETVIEQFGQLDILVNNAGVQIEKTVLETTDEEWNLLMGVNTKGVFLLCRALIPHMTHGGSIVNIGSISATAADPQMALYNASKAFVHGLTRSIAIDHGPAVRCNAIAPGWILTGMADTAFALADDPSAAEADARGRHPSGRFGSPEDVAKLAVWLASDEAAFATGQIFTLDGGLTAASPIRPSLY